MELVVRPTKGLTDEDANEGEEHGRDDYPEDDAERLHVPGHAEEVNRQDDAGADSRESGHEPSQEDEGGIDHDHPHVVAEVRSSAEPVAVPVVAVLIQDESVHELATDHENCEVPTVLTDRHAIPPFC